MKARKATVSSASICREFGAAGVDTGASGLRTRERVQKGTKAAYEPTSETTAYSCRRVYLETDTHDVSMSDRVQAGGPAYYTRVVNARKDLSFVVGLWSGVLGQRCGERIQVGQFE